MKKQPNDTYTPITKPTTHRMDMTEKEQPEFYLCKWKRKMKSQRQNDATSLIQAISVCSLIHRERFWTDRWCACVRIYFTLSWSPMQVFDMHNAIVAHILRGLSWEAKSGATSGMSRLRHKELRAETWLCYRLIAPSTSLLIDTSKCSYVFTGFRFCLFSHQ